MIKIFAQSFFCEYKAYTLPATIAAGAAIETAFLAKKLYQNPSCIKNRVTQIKNSIKTSFTQNVQENESSEDFHRRLAISIVKLTAASLLIAGTAVASFLVLPTIYAIPLAISITLYIGKLFCNLNNIKSFFESKKTWLIEAFKQKDGEKIEDFKKRLCKNIAKTTFYVILIASAVALIAYITIFFLPGAIQTVASGGFDLSSLLPPQTPLVVFLEYLTVGALHLWQAVNAYRKEDQATALFHGLSALLSVFFPVSYATSLISGGLRLHHSFLGLLFQLAPWRPVKVFGCVITFDSFLYMFSPVRGCLLPPSFPGGPQNLSSYDFMNTVVDNFPLVINGLVSTSVIQELNSLLPEKEVSPAPKLSA